MRVLIPSLLALVAGLFLGFGLGEWLRPSASSAPPGEAPAEMGRPRAPDVAFGGEPAVSTGGSIEPLVGSEPVRVLVDQEEELSRLRLRVQELEARLAAAADDAEPRLAAERLRRRGALRDALDQQSLRFGELYRDMLDFITLPSLIAEYPVEYLECLERAVLSTGVASGGALDPETSARVLRMNGEEGDSGGVLRFKRFARGSQDGEGAWVQWTMPDSLPLPHPSHLAYRAYAEFAPSGELRSLSLFREGAPAFSMQRTEEGSLTLGSSQTAPWRTPAERERLYADLSTTFRRLASMGR